MISIYTWPNYSLDVMFYQSSEVILYIEKGCFVFVCLFVFHLNWCGFKSLSLVKVWDDLGIPFVIGVDIKVVPGYDHKACGCELLPGDGDLHDGLFTLCILVLKK